MKKTLYKDIKECNIKLIIIIGILFIMFSGFTSYSIFTDTVVSNNVITVKVGKKRYTLTINQTSEEILTCTNNTTGECSTSSLQVAKDESVSCTVSDIDDDYTLLTLEIENDLISDETFIYNYEGDNTITPTYVKKTPDYCFEVYGNELNTSGACDLYKNVVIPSSIDGVKITGISSYAFEFGNLTSVVIPYSVTTIGVGAFSTIGYDHALTIYNNSGKSFDWSNITQDRSNSVYTFVTGSIPSYTIGSSTYGPVEVVTGYPE